MTFIKIEEAVWNYEKTDDNVIGVLINIKEEVGVNKSKMYVLEYENKCFNVWGTVVLDNLMSHIKVGDLIKIIYKGLGSDGKTKLFDLYKDDGTSINDEVEVKK